ncbi:MAG: flagellar hook-length control protein FliK, partial [Actinomycetota bacterium]|nr:flagellar hook-length control protein FliK [Actinomycetota bacterium]
AVEGSASAVADAQNATGPATGTAQGSTTSSPAAPAVTAPAVPARSDAAAATPAAAADTPDPAPTSRGVELAELGARLGASLRRNERTQTLTIQLHPAELGAITVEARLVDGVTHLHLSADSSSTGDRLASSMAELRHQLARAGVDLGDLDLGDRRQHSADDTSAATDRSRALDGAARRAAAAADGPSTDRASTHRPSIHRGGLVAIDL